MKDEMKAMSNDVFRVYILDRYAALFPLDFEEAQKKSYGLQYLPQCEAGWHDLIDEALQRIEAYLRQEGWLGNAFVRQVKEKFGSLRIYIRPDAENSWPDEVAEGIAAIRIEIEARSDKICEICGRQGQIEVIDHYHQCLCTDHRDRHLRWVAEGRPDRDWR
jgi:hypothetical protein